MNPTGTGTISQGRFDSQHATWYSQIAESSLLNVWDCRFMTDFRTLTQAVVTDLARVRPVHDTYWGFGRRRSASLGVFGGS